MTRIVILQPHFLPWLGVFDQIRLADIYVHFDDAAVPQGRSFASRVQLKTAEGQRWLTAPMRRNSGDDFRTAAFDDEQPWRRKHVATLTQAFDQTQHWPVVQRLIDQLYAMDGASLGEWNMRAIESVAAQIGVNAEFVRSSVINAPGAASDKLINTVRALGGDRYLTGHGARNYLDHEAFEQTGIDVEYVDYDIQPYDQRFGAFTPYVSCLDGLAYEGGDLARHLQSQPTPWRAFLSRTASAT